MALGRGCGCGGAGGVPLLGCEAAGCVVGELGRGGKRELATERAASTFVGEGEG